MTHDNYEDHRDEWKEDNWYAEHDDFEDDDDGLDYCVTPGIDYPA